MSSWRFSILLVTVLLMACQHSPPQEAGQFREPDLVEVVTLDPTIHLDIRYATANNFMHRPMYAQARAFLQRPAAEALLRVHRSLTAKGYGLLVFDAYRPWSITKLFWGLSLGNAEKDGVCGQPTEGVQT